MRAEMKYCCKCVYPYVAANLEVDGDGKCSSCRTAERFESITPDEWRRREAIFEKHLATARDQRTAEYDCIIPVSGGKDSYYQTHIVVDRFRLKPLLVTYHGNNYLPEGDFNRDRMREVFDADHMVFGPSTAVLKKLNRLCFKRLGDMNWHAHCGISTFPVQMAVRLNIPIIIWGEIAWDISGMYDPEDFVEFSARVRHEHDLRGYEWYDMLNDPVDCLSEKDLTWAKYPSDEAILRAGVRGLYLGNYFKWTPNAHTELIKQKYGWKSATVPFERTYRMASNLDDRYENGIHDYLKFVKFGYGRASDHASKDIRCGEMTRDEGVQMVRQYDHVMPSDLYHWLAYVEMSEEEFWITADGFRDPRVWWIEDDQWWKHNLWGGASSYGRVRLPTNHPARQC